MAARSQNAPWLFGATIDLALGCGWGYVAIFLAFSVGGAPLRLAQPEFVVPLLSVLLSGPHYGATILRVYEHREDRRAYALFSVWATLLVLVLFVVSLYDPLVASWFFTVYVTWSPWHYSGQNYGVSMMFLRRAGVDISPLAKRLLHTSFTASFLITFLVIHTQSETRYNPNPFDYATKIVGQPLGFPLVFGQFAMAIVSIVYLASTLGAFALLGRGGNLRALGPVAGVVLTQALWFTLPFSVGFWGIQTGLDPLDAGLPAQYVFWSAIGHALQYQFVTTYYARSSEGWRGYRSYLGKCLAAGAAVWTLPAIIFAPDFLGEREFSAGLGALVAAAVNLHHFILDGAIWKLRNSRIANILIRSNHEVGMDEVRTSRHWPARALWAACGVIAVIRIGLGPMEFHSFPAALRSGHYDRADSLLDALSWFGRDSSHRRSQLASALSRAGDPARAEEQALRSLELKPSVAAWSSVAVIRESREDWQGAIDAYHEGRLLGGEAGAGRLAELAMRGYYRTDRPDRAHEVFEETVQSELAGRDYAILAGVARDASDIPYAIRGYVHALRVDPRRHSAGNNLAWILATTAQATLRDPATAVALAERAVEMTDPPDLDYLDTLATAYAAADRNGEAIRTAERALALALEKGDDRAARAARESLSRFRNTAGAISDDTENRPDASSPEPARQP